MKITEAEWNATVENLVKALDKNKVRREGQAGAAGRAGADEEATSSASNVPRP